MSSTQQQVTALIAYPLSMDYQQQLEQTLGTHITYITLQQLKQYRLWGLLKQLYAIKGSLIIPLEDPTSIALLPIFKILSLFTRAYLYNQIDHEGVFHRFSRWSGIGAILKLLIASMATRIAMWRVQRQVNRRLTLPDLSCIPVQGDILFINANLWFGVKAGGSIGHVAGVCNALAEKGYRITYAAVEPNPCLRNDIQFLSLTPLTTYGMPYEANNYRFHLSVTKQLSAWILKHHPVLIYQRLSLGNMSGVILAQRFKVPLVIEYNGSETWIAKHWGRGLRFQGLAEKVEQACLLQANYIVTISDSLQADLNQRGVVNNRIIMYPNGIDPSRFDTQLYDTSQLQAYRARLNIPQEAVVCTFVGTFGLWHGVDVLAKAIVELSSADKNWLAKNDVYFVFVGDGVQMPKVKQLIQKSDAESHCRFVGLVPQLEAPIYLAMSQILLSPHKPNENQSRFFGSPTKLFEYMAMGKAIIASDLEQIGDVLSPGIHVSELPDITSHESAHAVLCEAGSSQDIVTALKWLVPQPDMQQRLGIAARKKVLANYTWSHHVAEILKPLVTG